MVVENPKLVSGEIYFVFLGLFLIICIHCAEVNGTLSFLYLHSRYTAVVISKCIIHSHSYAITVY
jgi:hypothetical protein